VSPLGRSAASCGRVLTSSDRLNIRFDDLNAPETAMIKGFSASS
jgi:hypothetical protein